MATAAQIKSAIRSQSTGQRQVSKQLAGVESLLQQADFSSKMADLQAKQKETMFATVASGLELASTFGEGLKQKAELESNIKAFEGSLPESVRKAGGVTTIDNPDRASLMDVLKGKKGSLTSFLYDEKEQYMLGENVLGSKYDVSAMGEKAKALKQTDLLDRFMEGEPLDSKSPTLKLEASPTLGTSFKSIYGKDTDIESLKDSLDKPLKDDATKKDINKIIVESRGGPLAPELIEETEDSLSSFLPRLSNLNVIPEDEYDPNSDRLTEQDVPSFAFDAITDGETDEPYVFGQDKKSNLEQLGITKKIGLKDVEGFSDVEGRWRNPEKALGELDRSMKKIASIEDRSRYSDTKGGEKSYQNALKKSAKLRKELKEKIKSIYNPKTGKFRSKEYKKIFEEGTGVIGEKTGTADVGAGINIGRWQLPLLQRQRQVDLTNIQSYINQLFPKDLASR